MNKALWAAQAQSALFLFPSNQNPAARRSRMAVVTGANSVVSTPTTVYMRK